jgi:nucleoside-diphosphate-sugar epimerase
MQSPTEIPLSPKQLNFIENEISGIVAWGKRINIQLPPRILVTGASGFIGQWVFLALRAIAMNSTGVVVLCETNNYQKLKSSWFPESSPNYKYSLEEDPFDLIYDLRLPVTGKSTEAQTEQSDKFYKNLVSSTQKLKYGGRLIHPSSGAVYGDLRFSEKLCENSTSAPSGLSIYGETKRSIESMQAAFVQNHYDLITPRIFSVFGPLMRENSPLIGNTFIRAAAQGIPIMGKITNNAYRDFAYITDLIRQFIYIGVYGSSVKNINLGTPNVAEIFEFGKMISSISKVKFSPGGTYVLPDRYYGCLHNLYRIEEFKSDTTTSLTESITKSIYFYSEKQ